METKHLNAIQQLHDHFKAHGQVVFSKCSRESVDPDLHLVSFEMKDHTKTTLLTLTLAVELEEAQLRTALSTVDPEGLLNILDNEERMNGFMALHAFDLIKHLRSFNGNRDDYEAIAQLVPPVRGATHSEVYGV